MNCHCKNVSFGDYSNTVTMIAPFDLYDILGDKKRDNTAIIDTCIATEIGYLWHQGVQTFNSCCGHQKMRPTVVIEKQSIERMKELGYELVEPEGWANPDITFYLKGSVPAPQGSKCCEKCNGVLDQPGQPRYCREPWCPCHQVKPYHETDHYHCFEDDESPSAKGHEKHLACCLCQVKPNE